MSELRTVPNHALEMSTAHHGKGVQGWVVINYQAFCVSKLSKV